MYESFFGLKERPFDLVPNPRFLYLSDRQREALGNLHYGLTVPRGFTLLLGEAGTGKTTLLQATLGGLDGAKVRFVLLSNPTLTRSEFYEALAEGFHLSADAARSKTRFLTEFRMELAERAGRGELSALVLDEAQSLPYELLEEVRLLSNVETPSMKLLNVVLAGQPELAGRLNEPGLRQLKQRISLRCELGALNDDETAAYIAGRLRIAGGDPASIFTVEAVAAISAASAGVPRTVNVVSENALIGGFAARVRPVPRVIVEEVVGDFDLGTRRLITGPRRHEDTKQATGQNALDVPIAVTGPRRHEDTKAKQDTTAHPVELALAVGASEAIKVLAAEDTANASPAEGGVGAVVGSSRTAERAVTLGAADGIEASPEPQAQNVIFRTLFESFNRRRAGWLF